MRRSGKLIASNDHVIEDLLADPNFDLRPDGTIWTLITRTGKVSATKEWRQAGRLNWRKPLNKDKGQYQELCYKYARISIHRIIYRKFNGPLERDLVINHIDGNSQNNRPENLELVTQLENNIHRLRKRS